MSQTLANVQFQSVLFDSATSMMDGVLCLVIWSGMHSCRRGHIQIYTSISQKIIVYPTVHEDELAPRDIGCQFLHHFSITPGKP